MHVHANGIDVQYTLTGLESAPVLLFSHSLATHLGMWRPQTEALATRYRLLCYDTRGHGGTDAPQGPYTLEELADDAAALLDALGIEKACWIGISMGGMIGQAFALSHPERLTGLALCDTTSETPPDSHGVWNERIDTALNQGLEPLVAPTIERWFSQQFIDHQSAVVESIRKMIRATPVAGYVGCCQAIMQLDFSERLAEIRTPTLIVVGENDPGTPVSASEAIHEKISGSQLAILPQALHLSNIERADLFNQTIETFLQRI